MINEYYVYAYLRKNGFPYYIGKGKGRRAYSHNINSIQPPKDKIRIVLLETNLTEIGAFAIERRLIRWFGRKDLNTGILYNRTDGGDGCAGIIPWNKNIPCTDSRKTNIQKATIGKKRTSETKLRMSLLRKNKPQTDNRIQANRNQRDDTKYNWMNINGNKNYCSKWDLLENYENLSIIGLSHVIYGYQTSHKGWKIIYAEDSKATDQSSNQAGT